MVNPLLPFGKLPLHTIISEISHFILAAKLSKHQSRACMHYGIGSGGEHSTRERQSADRHGYVREKNAIIQRDVKKKHTIQ